MVCMTKRDTIYDGKIIKVYKAEVLLPGEETEVTREVVKTADAVAIVPVIDDQVVLVKQYRPAVDTYVYELPAGKIDGCEAPRDCAIRELQEEIGYAPGKLEWLSAVYASPGYSTEKIHIYLAYDLKPSKLEADDDERIEVIKVPFETLLSHVHAGTYVDAKTCLGITLGWHEYSRCLKK